MQLGDLPGAQVEFEAEPHAIFHLSGLAIVQRKMGDKAKAEAYFEQLVREEGDAAAYQQAQVLAQWGEANQAIAALQKARAVGDSGLIYLATDPMLDPIRDKPAFAQFARAVGLA